MQTGYYNATAGMVAQFNRLDTIANNLANVNTTGFKEDSNVIGDFMRVFKEARDELPLANHSKQGAQFLNRALAKAPQIVEGYTDHSIGTMQNTGNPLDLALSKEGLYFAVKTPNGVRFTRDGSFSISDEGTLITKQGYEVLPQDYESSGSNISFTSTENIIEVDKNGQVLTNIPNSVKLGVSSKIFIGQPDNTKLLVKEGDNLFKYEGLEEVKNVVTSQALEQGFLEKSNVNAVKMMTQMIETNRLVGMYQKVMSSQMDDMNNDAINKIAKKA